MDRPLHCSRLLLALVLGLSLFSLTKAPEGSKATERGMLGAVAAMEPSSGTAPVIELPAGAVVLFDQARVPLVWQTLLARARWNGWDGRVKGPVSGLRTYLQQERLYGCFMAGSCPPAFPPDGPSRHLQENVRATGPWASAVDVTRARELIRVAAGLGVWLTAPYAGEPWHVEAAESFTEADIRLEP